MLQDYYCKCEQYLSNCTLCCTYRIHIAVCTAPKVHAYAEGSYPAASYESALPAQLSEEFVFCSCVIKPIVCECYLSVRNYFLYLLSLKQMLNGNLSKI